MEKGPVLLEGVPALSDFRLERLKNDLADALPSPGVADIHARFVYLLDVEAPFDGDLATKATALLGATKTFRPDEGFCVTPRKGTISPWSSKATDIFHNCGLTGVHRVERGVHYRVIDTQGHPLSAEALGEAVDLVHDRMVEGVYTDLDDFFVVPEPAPLEFIDVIGAGRAALKQANVQLGLALRGEEIDYLFDYYAGQKRNPTDVELVMFGQVNSEHCRHKIFNADWVIDGEKKEQSLFDMIRHTHATHPEHTLVAYKDNAGVVEGFDDRYFLAKRNGDSSYGYIEDRIDMIMKVETHNHPTAIAPYPGAATGVGGEIRDESATGTGGKSKAGLAAFMVSHLRIPGFSMPWEKDYAEFPTRLATPLRIMTEGPIGGARFGNEYGRPQLLGIFRTYEEICNGRYRGYHKPIMAAGGMGNIRRGLVQKKEIPAGACIVQLGGPAMKIGLGGGAASSMDTGQNEAELDFDSVQRDNAEMERRCQEVIETCIAAGDRNPILSIHDIGAGGLSNGSPELVAESGGAFQLRAIHNEDLSMSPMQIWCCEAQERYVLAVLPEDLDRFMDACNRERCPAAVIGRATGDGRLTLTDEQFDTTPIDLDIHFLLGKPPKMTREVTRLEEDHGGLDLGSIDMKEAAERVLRFPAVANKTFLITIADRSITGQVARDQMVGPYQTPIADAAVTLTSYTSYHGEAMAMGERTPLAVISAAASGRMAIGEALTNLASVPVGSINKVKLSANWMCGCGEEGEDANLFDTVQAVALDLCPRLGISIPVGKDSLSMRTVWEDSRGKAQKQIAPLSLIASAFATVDDVRKTVTPDLKPDPSILVLVDLGQGKNRLGGSVLAQVHNETGGEVPDLDDPELLVRFFAAVQELLEGGLLLAYHDRSDGGLFAALAEMAFGARTGLNIQIGDFGECMPTLFSEELGAVLQVAEENIDELFDLLGRHGLADISHNIGSPTDEPVFSVACSGEELCSKPITELNRAWSELTYRMQALRDNPDCAREEWDNLLSNDPGMSMSLSFNPSATFSVGGARPRMAILREQGINGQTEMAAAFDRAGFESVDVHMTDLQADRVTLDGFAGLVACGGFSYGDVLGAGSGWAKSILYNERLKEAFAAFFARPGTFALGVCNGCQMLSQLKEIIPGAEAWPAFVRNRSEQFEARFVSAEILPSPSVLFRGMEGSRLGVPVAHGEGRVDFGLTGSAESVKTRGLAAVRYVDHGGRVAERYPFNPNGSPEGLTGLTTPDGRVTIMMPHPERVFRAVQLSYAPRGLFRGDEGPWLRLFQNARSFVNEA